MICISLPPKGQSTCTKLEALLLDFCNRRLARRLGLEQLLVDSARRVPDPVLLLGPPRFEHLALEFARLVDRFREVPRPFDLGDVADGAPFLAEAVAVLFPDLLALVDDAEFLARVRFPDSQVRVVRAGQDEARVESVSGRENPASERRRESVPATLGSMDRSCDEWTERTAASALCDRYRDCRPGLASTAAMSGHKIPTRTRDQLVTSRKT